jgi:ankyrin repeat protein
MPAPPTLITIAPELVLAIAEHLPLHGLQALVRCNRLLYHLLLRVLYQRAVDARLEFNCDNGTCLVYTKKGRKGCPWLGNARQVTLCLAAGLDVNASVYCHGTYTRLHIAAAKWGNNDTWEEEEEVMRLLLAHGADVNAVATGGESPLHVAIERSDRSEILPLLLDLGADVNKTDEKGRSPLHYAVTLRNRRPSAVRILLEYGADPNNVDWKGRCPLHYAVRFAPEQTRLLLERGADPNKVDERLKTPLHYAVKYAPEQTRLLLERGADPNKVDGRLETPLHYAVKFAPKMTKLLLERGADPNKVDGGLETPLLYALRCRVWEPELVLLLEHGADANLADGNGYLPLHYAVTRKRPCCRMVACLLKHGADPNLWEGRSPLQDALLGHRTCYGPWRQRREFTKIIRLLVKAGALVEMLGEQDRDLVKTILERRSLPTPAPVPAEPTPNITLSLPQRSSTESDTTGPAQPPPTSEPPDDEMEEGWTKVERRKGKGKTEKKVEHRAAGGGPTWADIARGSGASVNVIIGRHIERV